MATETRTMKLDADGNIRWKHNNRLVKADEQPTQGEWVEQLWNEAAKKLDPVEMYPDFDFEK